MLLSLDVFMGHDLSAQASSYSRGSSEQDVIMSIVRTNKDSRQTVNHFAPLL